MTVTIFFRLTSLANSRRVKANLKMKRNLGRGREIERNFNGKGTLFCKGSMNIKLFDFSCADARLPTRFPRATSTAAKWSANGE